MNEDNKQKTEPRRNIPGGFFVFLLAIVLLILTFQGISSEKTAKVSFSHEVEHLVNLDLIQELESRKIALNDNLVTFSGRFRDRITDEARARYRYLELLNREHELQASKEHLDEEVSDLRKQVVQSAQQFLRLSGVVIPKGGYRVIDSIYDTPQSTNLIVVKELDRDGTLSLADLQTSVQSFDRATSASTLQEFGKQLLFLVQGFRSPVLGIGSEPLKAQLKSLEQKVEEILSTDSQVSVDNCLILYRDVLGQLQTIVSEVDREQQGMRLLPLRSVRNYKEDLSQQTVLNEDLLQTDAQLDKARESVGAVSWFFNNQEFSTRMLEKQDREVFGHWFTQAKKEWENFNTNKGLAFKAPDQPRNLVLEKTFKSEEPSPNYFGYILTLLPVIMVVLLLYFVFSRQMKGVGSGALNFGKSPAKLLTKDHNKVTFKDVAGCDEAKEELQEIVDFLKDPAKFTSLGARIPKGVLLIGAPGTGKTLIAKAVAGEADRPFFSISGSDFVEMFVGVGASRIRDMFEQAKKHAPCIIFMDEIDAVGRHRGAGIGGGHDEREQTLNQLLVEMDGFDTSEGVILIAATNRPDVLDKALLRPGRFDRRIVIDLPDIKGRFEILKVHARKIKLDASVNLMNIARNTPGASGADLENILNESALLAARRGRSAVTAIDVEEACDKVRYGKERKSLELDQNEKRTTAYHESGHALVALVVQHADPVDKVTIIPRGLSLGATHFMPKKNRVSYWKKELIDQLAVLLGGRAAEEVFVGDISSGAQMDITQATRLVRSMVCEWGMNEKLGLVAYGERSDSGQYLGMSGMQEKHYSEETAKLIDEEVLKLLNEAHERALSLVQEHRDKIELMTNMLMEFETLDREDVQEIMKGEWSVEKKRARIKLVEEAHRKLPPPPPPAPKEVVPPTNDIQPQQI